MGVFRCVRIWLLVHVTSTVSQLQVEIGCALAMEGIHVQGSTLMPQKPWYQSWLCHHFLYWFCCGFCCRHLTRSSTMCSLSSLSCRPLIALLASVMTQSSSSTSTKDGKQLHYVELRFVLFHFEIYCTRSRLYPIDKTRVNEFGQTFDEEAEQQKKEQ